MATVVLGVTGSIAAYKACELTRLFVKNGDNVNPTGYQYVLYATIALYVLALLFCLFFVKKAERAKSVR